MNPVQVKTLLKVQGHIVNALFDHGARNGEDPVNLTVKWDGFGCGPSLFQVPKEVWAALGLPE